MKFNSGGVNIERVIYTNDKKKHIEPEKEKRRRNP